MRAYSPFTTLFILLSLLVVNVCIGLRTDDRARFTARHGVLDLRGYDLDDRSTVEFGGEWALFWQRQLDPNDFRGATSPTPDGFLTLPGSWKGLPVSGQTLGEHGFATLRLTLLADPARSLQALRIAQVYSAYRLWVDGQLVAESGRVGQTRDDEIMNHSLRLAALRIDGRPLEIILQVSSFHMAKTALPLLQLGRHDDLNAAQNRVWGLALFAAGTLLLMGTYHIALYVLYRPNRAPLFFGIYCLVWTGFIISNTTSDWAIRVFFPELTGELLYRTSLFYYALAAPLSYHVFRSLYPQEFPRWPVFVFWGLGGSFAAISVAGPTPLSSAALPFFHLVVAARAGIFLWALSLATRRKREGAAIILTGFIVVCVLSFNDILSDMGLIRTPRLMHVGMLFFMLTQSLALARRFTGLFTKVEKLSIELADKNRSLEKEITTRSTLQQEIVSISEEERRRISQELHDGLCQQLTGARLQSTFLESASLDEYARADGQARLSKLLTESVDQAYELSRGLWLLAPDSDDICGTLTALARSQSESSRIPIHVDVRSDLSACTTANGMQIFYIAREAIVNAVKHARPSRIEVSLDCHEEQVATLCVSDDGVGRRSAKRNKEGLGLRIMAYRAQMVGGSFRIEDREGGGTRVTCLIPCGTSTAP